MPRAYPFQGYVLVAMPNRFSEVTRRFGEELALSAPAQRAYEHRLEVLAHRAIADFTGTNLIAEAGRPALIVHARDDADVGFEDAVEIAAACGDAQLHAVDGGLGHREDLLRSAGRACSRGLHPAPARAHRLIRQVAAAGSIK